MPKTNLYTVFPSSRDASVTVSILVETPTASAAKAVVTAKLSVIAITSINDNTRLTNFFTRNPP